MYQVIITPDAKKEIEELNKSGQDSEIRRLKQLLLELSHHPKTGMGKPEELGEDKENAWSRRISEKNRLVYRIDPEKREVTVIRAIGHYTDH